VTGFPGVTSDSSERVSALARFQTTILKHALQFPALERLTYSTCSVFREENEDVVAAVLPFARELGLELAPALQEWHRRGLHGVYPWVDKVVRVHPELDDSDGFFVALFERQQVQ
jgi:25S rRNA (cytosine2278-C5)-methyltransferase